jgi:L-ascorbate metabolism protein UlaG (beta-lactamase superfamily)
VYSIPGQAPRRATVSGVDAELRFDPEESIGAGATSVRVSWLGTAGFRLHVDDFTILVDPYVTRASMARCALGPLHPDTPRIVQTIERADAILVGHTHFDHLLDVPVIARLTDAHVYGSTSAERLCVAQGVPRERFHTAESGRETTFEIGPACVRFVPSRHSGLMAGRVPFPGEIEACDGSAMRIERYRHGQVFAIEIEVGSRKLVHLGSAYVPGDAPRFEADLLMLCAAGWRTSRDYPERAARVWSPRAVVLSHWDNFFLPIERGAVALPGMRLPALADKMRKAASRARVGALELLAAVRI